MSEPVRHERCSHGRADRIDGDAFDWVYEIVASRSSRLALEFRSCLEHGGVLVRGTTERGAAVGWQPSPWDAERLEVGVVRFTEPVLWGAAEPAFDLAEELRCIISCALADSGAERSELVVLRSDVRSVAALLVLQESGFVLHDTLVTLTRSAAHHGEAQGAAAVDRGGPTVSVTPARPGETRSLSRLGEAFTTDHFHADPRLDRDAIRRLYAAWITNSLSGRADHTLVARDPGGDPLGILTCRLQRGQEGTGGLEGIIELLAVSPAAQGRGVGRRLVDAASEWFAERGCDSVVVGTQIANTAAVRLYQAAGFHAASFAYTFHRWPRG